MLLLPMLFLLWYKYTKRADYLICGIFSFWNAGTIILRVICRLSIENNVSYWWFSLFPVIFSIIGLFFGYFFPSTLKIYGSSIIGGMDAINGIGIFLCIYPYYQIISLKFLHICLVIILQLELIHVNH